MYRYLSAGLTLLLTIHTSIFSGFFHLGRNFQDYAMEIFCHELSSDTLSLHYMLADPSSYGIQTDEASFGDLSAETWKEQLQWLSSCRERIQKYLNKKLNDEDRLAAELLDW